MNDLKVLRAKIFNKVVDFMLSEDKDALILEAFPGGGKTTTTMNAVDSVGAKWIYIAPTHDVIDENIENSPHRHFMCEHLKSRGKVCMNPVVRELFELGYGSPKFCDGCKFTCEYTETQRKVFRTAPNLAIVHSHIQTWLPMFLNMEYEDGLMKDQYDVIIIDENPVNTMYETRIITHRNMTYIRQHMLRVHNFDREMYEILGLMQMNPIPYEEILVKAENIYSGKKRKEFLEDYSELIFKEFGMGHHRPYSNALPFLYDVVDYNNTLEKLQAGLSWVKGEIRASVFKHDIISSLGMRVIGLDGTASIEVWERILGTTSVEVFPAKYHYERAYQLRGPGLPITTWKKAGEPFLEKYMYLIRRIVEKRKTSDTLIIATKGIIENILSPRLANLDNVQYAWFYNLRSKNSFYEKCDTVILVCEPNPPPYVTSTAAILSGWPDDVWRRLYTWDEMIQAIGRIRGNMKVTTSGRERDIPEVYILPSTGVGYTGVVSSLIPEAMVVDYDGLLDILDGRPYTKERYVAYDFLEAMPISAREYANRSGLSYKKVLKIARYLENVGYAEKSGRVYKRTVRAPPKRGKITVGYGTTLQPDEGFIEGVSGEDCESIRQLHSD